MRRPAEYGGPRSRTRAAAGILSERMAGTDVE